MFYFDNQNFIQLSFIQGASYGLSGFLMGNVIASKYGIGVAIPALCIGNLLLWIVGLVMFVMTYEGPGKAESAMGNVRVYLGKTAAILASLVLMLAFMSWFSIQLKSQMNALESVFGNGVAGSGAMGLRIGIFFACITTFIAMGGIRTIRWVCTIAFPIIAAYAIYFVWKDFSHVKLSLDWNVSLPAIVSVVASVFPGVINLPTFFRHARSKADGLLGLGLMTFFVIVLQLSGIWFVNLEKKVTGVWLIVVFIVLTTLCVNLVNIYFASAALEQLHKRFAHSAGFAVIGLSGTLIFGILRSLTVMNAIEFLTTSFLGCLGVMLLAGFLVRLVVRHRPRPWEQHVNFGCWVVGCLTSIVLFFCLNDQQMAFLGGIYASLLAFILEVFIEETVWSTTRLITKRPRKE